MIEQNLFKWRHFQADIILLCVRWGWTFATCRAPLLLVLLLDAQMINWRETLAACY